MATKNSAQKSTLKKRTRTISVTNAGGGKQKRAARAGTGKTAKRRAVQTKKLVVRKKSATPAAKVPAARKTAGKAALGRPRISGTTELDLMFRKDREAREICEFLGVRTLKELEAYTPDQIVEQLTAPVVRSVGRIRKSLAVNNRCLAGDQKFAVAFKKQFS
jgi:hypothetical protein